MTLADSVYAQLLVDIRGRDARSRGELARRAAATLGVSLNTVYRNLRRLGWESGRKTRKDKGTSSIDVEQLRQVAAVVARGRNKRGQPNVPLKEAHQIGQEQGFVGQVSYGHLARRLREQGLGLRHMRAPEASIARVSRHANAVWFFDISVAIQWFFRDEKGHKLGQYEDAGARFYEGKRANLAKVRRVLHRFLMVDHYSGAYYCRYYYSAGEESGDVVDFLWHAMAAKPSGEAFPFRGVPGRLVLDQGSANKSGIVVELLRSLGVEVEYHAPGNAKASGAVEARHNHWQRSFEGRMAQRPATDLEELNGWAERFAAVLNGQRKHTRHGRPPLELWASSVREHLVEAPEREVFLQLASAKPKTGTLDNRHWLRAKGRTWLISGANVHGRQKVQYRLAPFADNGVRVWDEHGRELAAEELRFDDAGFPLNGRRHVWDDESAPGATAPPTPAHTVEQGVEQVTADAPAFPTMFDELERRLDRQAYLAGQGTPWTPADADDPAVAEPLMGSLDAREEVVRRLDRHLSRDEAAWWKARIGDGITASRLEEAWLEFTTGVAQQGNA